MVSMITGSAPLRKYALFLSLVSLCAVPVNAWAMSPFVAFSGAYFPSWLLCAAIGIIISVLTRSLLIRLGIDDGIPLRTLVYIALALLIAFLLSFAVFGR